MSLLVNTTTQAPATRNVVESIILGIILTALSYGVGLGFGWVSALNWLEVFAVFTSYACTYLCVRERRINYPIGAVSNAAYCVLFAMNGLVGSAIVTGYLTFSLAYGWFRWKTDTNTKPIAYVKLKWWPVYVIATGIAFFFGLQLYGVFNVPVIWTDAVVMAGSILAQFLLDNKKMENWVVWAVVNVFAIITYVHAGLALAAFQYVTFLLNTVYGWVVWRNAMKDDRVITQQQMGGVFNTPLTTEVIR